MQVLQCHCNGRWNGWNGRYGWNGNVILPTSKNLKKAATCSLFFAKNKHAVEFKINPSLSTLKLLSAKVLPVEVISVIISEDPINGYVSVAPRLGIILYW